jgi:hypothetical protein
MKTNLPGNRVAEGFMARSGNNLDRAADGEGRMLVKQRPRLHSFHRLAGHSTTYNSLLAVNPMSI